MPAQSGSRYAVTCSSIGSAITDLTSRIRVSENNQKIKADCESQIDRLTKALNVSQVILEITKPMLADIKYYLNVKRAECMQNLNNALRIAEEIIPDSEPGTHFELNGDKVSLLSSDGLSIKSVEGDGFQQASSAFLRAVVVQSNPEILNTLIFDESFALVSVQNSANLSLYLNILASEMQIISIEQKPEVYSNIDCVAYHFDKTDGFAEVTRSDIKRGDISADSQTM